LIQWLGVQTPWTVDVHRPFPQADSLIAAPTTCQELTTFLFHDPVKCEDNIPTGHKVFVCGAMANGNLKSSKAELM
jgi:hypothetical protein